MLEYIAHLIDIIGASFLVAAIGGTTLGFYLAAINRFLPTPNILKAFGNDIVIGLSFFLPILVTRGVQSNGDPAVLDRWIAAIVLWMIFSLIADAVNWTLCNIHVEKIRK